MFFFLGAGIAGASVARRYACTHSVVNFFLYELVIELTLRVTLTAPRPVVKATCLDNGRARYIPLYAPSLVEVMKV